MALNLGPAAFDAVTNMKNTRDWRAFVDALREQMNVFMHKALEVPYHDRQDATGYARGIRDIVAHIELVESPATPNRNPKPQVKSHG
jgi:hypothetical protein